MFTPMLQKQFYWGVKWGCVVYRADRVPIGKRAATDQWVQKERSVKLSVMWVCAKSSGEMLDGVFVKVAELREKDPRKQ